MTRLQQLFAECGQSPWLDNLTRAVPARRDAGTHGRRRHPRRDREPDHLRSGDRRFRRLTTSSSARSSPQAIPCSMPIGSSSSPTFEDACAVLRPTFDASSGTDGFVSIEVAPELARDTDATVDAAPRPAPADRAPEPLRQDPRDTPRAFPAIRAMTAEGRSINVTLIFSLSRYAEVIDAYIAGSRTFAAAGGDLADGPQRRVVLRQPSRHRGRPPPRRHRRPTQHETCAVDGAIAQAKLAYQLFRSNASPAIAGSASPQLGARRAAPALGIDLDQESRLRRHAVRRQPDRTRHRQHPAREARSPRSRTTAALARTIDADVDDAHEVMHRLARVGIDMDDVGAHPRRRGRRELPRSRSRTCSTRSTPKPVSSRSGRRNGLGRLGAVRSARDRDAHRGHDRRAAGRAGLASTFRCCWERS